MSYVKQIRQYIGTIPIILVGATIIVFNEQHHLLLQHRSDTLEWGLPGGAMEIGESLIETATRELHEETGLQAKSLYLIDVLSGSELYFKYPNGDEIYNVIVLYQANEVQGDLKINDSESLELAYFDIKDLPLKLDNRARYILEKYL